MTDMKHTHPWDEAIDNGPGWKDSYAKQVGDKAVRYDSNIEAPETQLTYARVTFPDGSCLYFGADGTEAVEAAIAAGGEVEDSDPWGTSMVRRPKLSWTDVPETDASRALGEWLKPLFDAPKENTVTETVTATKQAQAMDRLAAAIAGLHSDTANGLLYREIFSHIADNESSNGYETMSGVLASIFAQLPDNARTEAIAELIAGLFNAIGADRLREIVGNILVGLPGDVLSGEDSELIATQLLSAVAFPGRGEQPDPRPF